mmetsp:Transcript_3418/g.7072  ORF Transcript_3418/g.7072 Transcript_3418/m.7072 type:complete len:247 (+) Transcript_3418:225-965(+)
MRCGFNTSLPLMTQTLQVRQRPPAPQFPSDLVSNRLASGSFSLTPRINMPWRRFSPAYISIVASGSFWEGGYCRRTVTFGRRRSRFTVKTNRSSKPGLAAGMVFPIASTVSSYPKHSVATENSSSFSEITVLLLDCGCVACFLRISDMDDKESPGFRSASEDDPPGTNPDTMVMPIPSSRPPAISSSSIPNPPPLSRFRGKLTVKTSTKCSTLFFGSSRTLPWFSVAFWTKFAVHPSCMTSNGRLY